MKKVTFQSGLLGFSFSGNIVRAVIPNSQADNAGVRIGWKILKINGEVQAINHSKSIFDAIQKTKKMETVILFQKANAISDWKVDEQHGIRSQKKKKTRKCRVIARNIEKKMIKVHYIGYGSHCDEWIAVNSSRIVEKGKKNRNIDQRWRIWISTLLAIVLSITMFCATAIYYFAIPDKLQQKVDTHYGTWGKPDSNFDWCEQNYQIYQSIAEPFNSLTSLCYIIVPLVGVCLNIQLDFAFVFSMFLISYIGLTSTLFHATLRYEMQILDELSIHYLVISNSYFIYQRSLKKHGWWLPFLLFLMEVILTISFFFTSKTEQIHDFIRLFVLCTFSIGVFYICTSIVAINEEISKLSGKDSWLLLISFILWLFSIFSWTIDIFFCSELHYLPLDLPYPQLHALGWHLGTAFMMYYIAVLLFLHRKLVMRRNVSIWWCSCFPLVTIGEKYNKKKMIKVE